MKSQHDDAADVPQPELPRDLRGRLDVRLDDGLRRILLAGVATRVHIHRHQGFGVLDDDVAAGLEVDAAPERGPDVLFDSELVENRNVPAVQLDSILELRD